MSPSTRRAPLQGDVLYGPQSHGRARGDSCDSGPALSPWPTCLWCPPRWPAHPRDQSCVPSSHTQGLDALRAPRSPVGTREKPPGPGPAVAILTAAARVGPGHVQLPGPGRPGAGVLPHVPGQQSRRLLSCWDSPGASCLFPWEGEAGWSSRGARRAELMSRQRGGRPASSRERRRGDSCES